MNKHKSADGQRALELDRLVTGELPENDRRRLLAWLDEEPTRWRSCGLAFLEAQAWEEAVSGIGVRERVESSEFSVQEKEGKSRRAEGREHKSGNGLSWLAIAGAMLLAFAVGTLAGSSWNAALDGPPRPLITNSAPIPSPSGPQLATVSVRTNLDPRLTAQVQLPVEPAAEPPSGGSSIPEYVRKQWERRGYELIEETRYLPARMPDGRTVMVPVNHVRLRHKGIPVS